MNQRRETEGRREGDHDPGPFYPGSHGFEESRSEWPRDQWADDQYARDTSGSAGGRGDPPQAQQGRFGRWWNRYGPGAQRRSHFNRGPYDSDQEAYRPTYRPGQSRRPESESSRRGYSQPGDEPGYGQRGHGQQGYGQQYRHPYGDQPSGRRAYEQQSEGRYAQRRYEPSEHERMGYHHSEELFGRRPFSYEDEPAYFGTGSPGAGGTGFTGGAYTYGEHYPEMTADIEGGEDLYGHGPYGYGPHEASGWSSHPQGRSNRPGGAERLSRRSPGGGGWPHREGAGGEWRGHEPGRERDWQGREWQRREGPDRDWQERSGREWAGREWPGRHWQGNNWQGREWPGREPDRLNAGWREPSSGQGWFRARTPGRGRPYPPGPKGYQRSDERLREDISERLMQAEHIDSSDVSVEVKGAKVVLEGTVRSRHMKHAIEDLVDACPGVQDIDNRIRVVSERAGEQGWQTSTGDQVGSQSETGQAATGGQAVTSGKSATGGQSVTSGQPSSQSGEQG